MTEIEFFLSDEPPDAVGPREEMGGAGRTRPPVVLDPRSLAGLVLFAGAAALAIAAPFQKLMIIREPRALPDPVNYSVDGWGRLDIATPVDIHDARYGIALCACAGGFALIAAALAASMVVFALRRFTKVVAAAGFGIATALGGVVAAMALNIDAYFDNQRNQTVTFGRHPRLDLRYGWCVWLGVAAVAAGLLAVAATVLAGRFDQHPTGATEPPGKLT